MNGAHALARMQDQLVEMGNALTHATLAGAAGWARLAAGQPPVKHVPGPATAHELVDEHAAARLLRYPSRTGTARGTVLVVPSLINRFYVLDLLPDVSVIDTLCKAGLDAYVLDWTAPGAGGLTRGFGAYVDEVIPWAVHRAVGAEGRVHVLGYCMGGTLAAIHAARHPEQVLSLTLMGAPIDFHSSGVLNTFTDPRWFNGALLADAFGNVPPLMLQSAFKLLNPAGPLLKMRDLFQKGGDEAAVRHFLAVESWLEDNIAFPGGLYPAYIRECYQENSFFRRTMKVDGTAADPAAITMPLLALVGTRDTIAAPDSSRGLLGVAGSTDKACWEFEGGHIGLSTSRRAIRELWPRVAQWMLQRSNVA